MADAFNARFGNYPSLHISATSTPRCLSYTIASPEKSGGALKIVFAAQNNLCFEALKFELSAI